MLKSNRDHKNTGLTIFGIPKPFQGHAEIVQTNAIQSWIQLAGAPNVILFGDEPGIPEFAQVHGCQWVPEIKTTPSGTPLVSDAFDQIRALARTKLAVYSNADIIFQGDFLTALNSVSLPYFVASGTRWNITLEDFLDFQGNWQATLKRHAVGNAEEFISSAHDYFAFPSHLDFDMPDLSVGRAGWDTWLLYRCKSSRVPVVDLSPSMIAYHSRHDLSHYTAKRHHDPDHPDSRFNRKSIRDSRNGRELLDADWVVSDERLKRPITRRRIVRWVGMLPHRHSFLSELWNVTRYLPGRNATAFLLHRLMRSSRSLSTNDLILTE